MKLTPILEIKDAEFVRLVQAAVEPFFNRVNKRLDDMTKLIDDVVAAETNQSAAISGLVGAVTQLVTLADQLKQALDNLVANGSLSEADKTALQSLITKNSADNAAIAASVQKIADTLVVDAPSN